jgi:GNAT superfamily N-acetyltransferase
MERDSRDGGVARRAITAAELRFGTAEDSDAAAIATLRSAVAERLTEEYGGGHWSGLATEAGVLRAVRTSRVLVAWQGSEIVATLRLATRKPWAIDATRYTQVARPLYLTDMAVDPRLQRLGIGRQLLAEAAAVARVWPADAIRLDSYDDPAGAGPFYEKCGYREVGRAAYRGTPLIYYELLLGT